MSSPLIEIGFSVDGHRAYGTSSMRQLEPGIWSLFAGDENGDGVVNATDFSVWLSQTNAGVS